MAFSLAFSRLIFRRGLAGTSNLFKSTTLTRRMISTAPAPIEPAISSSPWMMLPPSFNADTTTNYNFYSLSENSIRSFPQTELTDLGPDPTRDVLIRGSSHGWLAIFNRENPDVFLYDPISLRRINLPPIENLPNHPKCSSVVDKLILTCSPDNSSCLAVMICNDDLYFCCPGPTTDKWTPFGNAGTWDGVEGKWTSQKRYVDIVYSEKQNLIFTLDNSNELETFDLNDPSSLIKKEYSLDDSSREFAFATCSAYLAVADDLFSDDKDDVLLVTRYQLSSPPDGWQADDVSYYRHLTFDFDVEVYDREDMSSLKGVVDNLGDRAIFIGPPSESVVLSASRFPELKPNSIYFTDQFQTALSYPPNTFRGDDVGIFDYGNKTMSSCYYPYDVQHREPIVPSPFWYHPRGPV